MIEAIEPLGKHDRAAFSCGVASLDDWFRLRAGQDEKRNVARVFVAVDDQGGIVGFYSLSSFTLAIAGGPTRRHAISISAGGAVVRSSDRPNPASTGAKAARPAIRATAVTSSHARRRRVIERSVGFPSSAAW